MRFLECIGKQTTGVYKCRRYILLLFLFVSVLTTSRAQFISIDNHTGRWSDAASWIGNISPGTSVSVEDIEQYGWLTAGNCLDYDKGQFTIHDTLIVYGGLTLLNSARLVIDPGGILIVFGNYYSNNQVEVENSGYFIVTGEFEMQGTNNQGFFHNSGGKVFLFDKEPEIKGGPNYADLACSNTGNYPESCGYGNYYNLMEDPMAKFFSLFGYDPEIDTVYNSCNVVAFEADRTKVCRFDTVLFTNLSMGFPENEIYTWNFGEGAVPAKITGTGPHKVVYESSGLKTVELEAYTQTGNVLYSRVMEDYILVGEKHKVILEDASRCGAGEVLINAYSDESVTVQFSNDGGITIAGESSSAPFEFPVDLDEGNNITVWARAVDSASGCMSDWDETALASAYPIPEVVVDDASRCGSGEVLINAYSDEAVTVQFSNDGGITIAGESSSAPFEFQVFLDEGNNITVWARAVDTTSGCMSDWDETALASAYPVPGVMVDDASRCGSGEIVINAYSDDAGSIQFSTDGGITIAGESTSEPFEFPVVIDEGSNITIWARAVDTAGGCMSNWDQMAIAYAYRLPQVIVTDTSRCGFGEVVITAYTDSINWIQFSTDGGNTVADEIISAPFEYPVFLEEGSDITIWARAVDTTSGCTSDWNQTATATAYPFPDVMVDDASRCGAGEIKITAHTDSDNSVQFSTDGGATIAYEVTSEPFEFQLYLDEWNRAIVWARAMNVAGCMSDWVQTAMVYAYPVPEVTIVGDTIICNGDELLFTVAENNFIDSYLWHDGSNGDSYSTYHAETISVTAWNNLGCENSDTLTITSCEKKEVASTTVYSFSPNGDGINDNWVLDDIESYPEAKIWVYDAAGTLVFHSPGGYQNDWDGTYRGKVLPVDSYYFVIDFSAYNKSSVTGIITLIYLH